VFGKKLPEIIQKFFLLCDEWWVKRFIASETNGGFSSKKVFAFFAFTAVTFGVNTLSVSRLSGDSNVTAG